MILRPLFRLATPAGLLLSLCACSNAYRDWDPGIYNLGIPKVYPTGDGYDGRGGWSERYGRGRDHADRPGSSRDGDRSAGRDGGGRGGSGRR